jgi:hypothetical protein
MTSAGVEGAQPAARLGRAIRTADGERFLAGLAGQKLRLNGCAAAAYAALYANVDVITAYPIRPYTAIMMNLSQFIADGILDAEYLHADGEHSQLSAAFGAGSCGARAFTGSSGVGVTYAYEMYSIISGARIPIQMAIADRTLDPPGDFGSEHTDALCTRDMGWLLGWAATPQEVFDKSLIAYAIGEEPRVLLPQMVVQDGYFTSCPIAVRSSSSTTRRTPAPPTRSAWCACPDTSAAGGRRCDRSRAVRPGRAVIGGPGPLGVRARQLRRPVLIPRLDGGDDLGVLGPGLVTARRRHLPVVPAHPPRHDLGQLGEHGVARDLRHRGVEVVVGGHRAVDVPALDSGRPFPPRRAQQRHGLGRRGPCREPGRRPLEQLAHVEKLVHLAAGRHVHERTLARAQVDPALGLEPVQGLAHRLPAHPELPGQLGFHQVLAGPEGAGHDELGQGLVHRLAQRDRPLDRPDQPRRHVVRGRFGHARHDPPAFR